MSRNTAVSALAPHVFLCYWYGRTLKELVQAEQAPASLVDSRHRWNLQERVRLYEGLLLTATAGLVLSEAEFVLALERVIHGRSLSPSADATGVLAQEARDLLRKWRDPRRDALYTYQ